MMIIPGFTAECSLGTRTRVHRRGRQEISSSEVLQLQRVMPAAINVGRGRSAVKVIAGTAYPSRAASARVGGIGVGGGGLEGFNAWGCWDSECCDCIPNGEPCWVDPGGYIHCPCDVVCEPCTRCIWPY